MLQDPIFIKFELLDTEDRRASRRGMSTLYEGLPAIYSNVTTAVIMMLLRSS